MSTYAVWYRKCVLIRVEVNPTSVTISRRESIASEL